jgi:hypothetical protein
MLKKIFSLFFGQKENKDQGALTYLADCGHKCKEIDYVSAYGGTTQTKISIVKGKTEYCHKCLEKMTIRCAWCGRPIFIGDQITLYSTNSNDFKAHEDSVIYDKKNLSYVGCPRRDCAETGADYCGIWIPPGKVYRQTSVIELALANPGCAVLKSGDKTKIIPLQER